MSLDRFRTTVAGLALATLAPIAAAAQLIQIKTLPIADGDQWRIFPSANAPMADLSIALSDSLLDPFVNPRRARASRTAVCSSDRRRSTPFRKAPAAGGRCRWAASSASARCSGASRSRFRSSTPSRQRSGVLPALRRPSIQPSRRRLTTSAVTPTAPSRENRFAFASLGRSFSTAGLSLAGSVLWSGLRNIDGVDLLYTGSAGVNQHGGALDARLGLTKEWATTRGRDRRGDSAAQPLRHGARRDLGRSGFDPNTRTSLSRARIDHNLDRTNTWGMQLAILAAARRHGLAHRRDATTNLVSHPKLPDLPDRQVMVIPWDPGTPRRTTSASASRNRVRAHDARRRRDLRADSHAHVGGGAVETATEARRFPQAARPRRTSSASRTRSCACRTARHELPMDSLRDRAARHPGSRAASRCASISYAWIRPTTSPGRRASIDEDWIEWTRTWGLSIRSRSRGALHRTLVDGRWTPGRARQWRCRLRPRRGCRSTSNVSSAPTVRLTLTGVSVYTHQFSVSLPIR